MARPRPGTVVVVAAYLALAAAPVVAMVAGLRDWPLRGVVSEAPSPRASLAAAWSEDLQRDLTTWFERHLGLRGWMIALDNTALARGFGEARADARVVFGDDGVLFERDDVAFLTKLDGVPTRTIAARADQLATLQRAWAARGVALVPVVIPSKTTLYRDAVPAAWRRARPDAPTTDAVYPAIARALDARGVRWIDSLTLFRAEPRARVWGPFARHWSAWGAMLVIQRVLATARALTGAPAIDFACTPTTRAITLRDDDLDLLALANTLGARPHSAPGAACAPPPSNTPRPSVVLIGSSFMWQLAYAIEDSRRFGRTDVDYYDAELVGIPEARYGRRPYLAGDAAWRDAFLGRDVVIVEIFETYLGDDGSRIVTLDRIDQAIAARP